jgi:hypothetical protein
MLSFVEWLKWSRWLIPSWQVVLKFAKDRILGVDIAGQHVPPRVRYGITFLLIRNTVVSMSCSVGPGMASYFVNSFSHIVQEGTFV